MGNKYIDLNFKRKCDSMNCSCYRAVKCLKHAMEVVERLLKRFHIIESIKNA